MPVDPENPYVHGRNLIQEAVAEAVKLDPDTEDAYVTGWVLIVETEHPSPPGMVHVAGGRGIAIFSSDATGQADLPPHTAMGWMMHAASQQYLFFQPPEEDEDEQ